MVNRPHELVVDPVERRRARLKRVADARPARRRAVLVEIELRLLGTRAGEERCLDTARGGAVRGVVVIFLGSDAGREGALRHVPLALELAPTSNATARPR